MNKNEDLTPDYLISLFLNGGTVAELVERIIMVDGTIEHELFLKCKASLTTHSNTRGVEYLNQQIDLLIKSETFCNMQLEFNASKTSEAKLIGRIIEHARDLLRSPNNLKKSRKSSKIDFLNVLTQNLSETGKQYVINYQDNSLEGLACLITAIGFSNYDNKAELIRGLNDLYKPEKEVETRAFQYQLKQCEFALTQSKHNARQRKTNSRLVKINNIKSECEIKKD